MNSGDSARYRFALLPSILASSRQKGIVLACRLIVILPIHNAACWLRRKVEDLLETLAETAAAFELVIVDVCSTDDLDLPGELAREYPQVKNIRKEPSQSLAALIDRIRAESAGEVIVHGGLSEVGDLDDMWREAAKTPDLPTAAAGPKGITGNLLAQLTVWGEQLRRSALDVPSLRPGSFLAHLRQLASAG
jgi:hypothetical protein